MTDAVLALIVDAACADVDVAEKSETATYRRPPMAKPDMPRPVAGGGRLVEPEGALRMGAGRSGETGVGVHPLIALRNRKLRAGYEVVPGPHPEGVVARYRNPRGNEEHVVQRFDEQGRESYHTHVPGEKALDEAILDGMAAIRLLEKIGMGLSAMRKPAMHGGRAVAGQATKQPLARRVSQRVAATTPGKIGQAFKKPINIAPGRPAQAAQDQYGGVGRGGFASPPNPSDENRTDHEPRQLA